ncbi:hemolysin III [Spirochaetia bacterium]|nr:hemolysin III [Spirochaetia bacterium]
MKTQTKAVNAYTPVAGQLPFQTTGEEIANAITHGLGAALSIAALVLLTLRANQFLGGKGGGAITIVSFVIFSSSLITLFLASTLYHAITHKGAKRVLRILDHSAIYLLIAGTYTPFCLVALRGAWGWSIFGVEWGLAVLGIVLHAVQYKLLKKIELFVYILMGWVIVIGWIPLVHAIPRISLIMLIAGGLSYTLGILWYRKKAPVCHVIWHVFVLAGAFCHWLSIWFMS